MTIDGVKWILAGQNQIVVADYLECCKELEKATGTDIFEDMTPVELVASFKEFMRDEYLTEVKI
jgi:hypothetical protein